MVRVVFGWATAALAVGSAAASSVNFVNKCSFQVELYHSQKASGATKVGDITPGGTLPQDVSGPAHMFRHGAAPTATRTSS
jgi:hypothetical protein